MAYFIRGTFFTPDIICTRVALLLWDWHEHLETENLDCLFFVLSIRRQFFLPTLATWLQGSTFKHVHGLSNLFHFSIVKYSHLLSLRSSLCGLSWAITAARKSSSQNRPRALTPKPEPPQEISSYFYFLACNFYHERNSLKKTGIWRGIHKTSRNLHSIGSTPSQKN